MLIQPPLAKHLGCSILATEQQRSNGTTQQRRNNAQQRDRQCKRNRRGFCNVPQGKGLVAVYCSETPPTLHCMSCGFYPALHVLWILPCIACPVVFLTALHVLWFFLFGFSCGFSVSLFAVVFWVALQVARDYEGKVVVC